MPYKVVTKDRKSCLATGSYCRNYFRDSVVEAPSGTLGIMTFRLKEQAREFAADTWEWMVIRVKGIGESTRPRTIANNPSQIGLDKFYQGKALFPGMIPLGTICYQSVKVLE